MANQEQLQRLRSGVQGWNAWRNEYPEEKIDLRGVLLDEVDLSEANLYEADLYGAYLTRANLIKAILGSANLTRANLARANLTKADLSGTNLYEADLHGADLSKANLTRANLTRANLTKANLTSAILGDADMSHASFRETVFANNDLRLVKGLVTVTHWGPSHIHLYSVQLPQDGSTLHFLRGVGVPDEWIDFYRAQMMHPIQYSSVFISYSSKDEQLARRLHADLQAQGVRCWFAPHDMRPSTYMRKEIDQAIHLQDKMLLLLSEDAIASGWVEHEVEIALAREREQHRDILFPIRLDTAILQITTGWAASLRKLRQIGDFTAWENAQEYHVAFERLLRDLNDTQS
jgi:hypothetical protein